MAGAVVGGTLSSFGLRAPLAFAAGVSLVGLGFAHAYLKDPSDLVHESERRSRDETAAAAAAAARVPSPAAAASEAAPLEPRSPWTRPRCLACGGLSFFTNVAYGGASVLLPLYVLQAYPDLPPRASGQIAGLLFGAIGVAQAVVMAVAFPSINTWLGGFMPTCGLAGVLLAAGVALVPVVGAVAASPFALLAPLTLVAVGNGLARPAYVSYLAATAEKGNVSQTVAIIDFTLNGAMARRRCPWRRYHRRRGARDSPTRRGAAAIPKRRSFLGGAAARYPPDDPRPRPRRRRDPQEIVL